MACLYLFPPCKRSIIIECHALHVGKFHKDTPNVFSLSAIFDDHMHLRKDGFLMEAVHKFESAGGTAFNLVNLPDYSLPPSGYYNSIFSETIRLADIVMRESSIFSLVTIGPYPLDYFYFEKAGMDPVEEMMGGIDLASKLIQEGMANAIGEIGRPHFPVPERIVDDCNSMIRYAIETAKDVSCAVVLHTEDLDKNSLRQLEEMAYSAGMDSHRLVKHHEKPENLAWNSGVTASILASRRNVHEALRFGKSFMLETDYVDDRSKPDKVIPADSVPKRAMMIKAENENWEEIFYNIFTNLPSRVYGTDQLA